jgi:hypothetical protein
LIDHNLVNLVNENNSVLLHCLYGFPLHLQHAKHIQLMTESLAILS